MKSHPVVIVLAVTVLFAHPALAAEKDEAPPAVRQTVSGPTGLLLLPSAYTTAHKQLSLSGSWYQDRLVGAPTANSLWGSGTYGFTDRLEGGFFYQRRFDGFGHDNGGGFLKYVLSPETDTEPAFAVGGSVGGGQYSPASAYVVLSRVLNHRQPRTPISGHLGVLYQSMRNYPVSPKSASSGIRLFGGIDFRVARRTSLLAEARFQQPYERKAFISGGVSHTFTDHVGLTAGFTNTAISQGIRPLVMMSLSFPLKTK